jgi:hypothetical protein
VHALAELFELVDERDVDAAVDVFKQLGHFRRGRGGDGDRRVEDAAVEGGGERAGDLAAGADDLGNIAAGDGVVAWVFALGGEGDVEDAGAALGWIRAAGHVGAGGFEAAGGTGFEQRDKDFLGGAGVGGALKHDELPGVQVRGDGAGGLLDVAQVGLMVLRERGGHADDDGVHGGDAAKVGGGGEAVALRGGDLSTGDADDVGAGGVERIYLDGIDVEAGDGEAFFRKEQGEWEPDVAHADDADLRRAGGDTCQGGSGGCGVGGIGGIGGRPGLARVGCGGVGRSLCRSLCHKFSHRRIECPHLHDTLAGLLRLRRGVGWGLLKCYPPCGA